MDTVKGIYHNGIVELIEKPEAIEQAEVLVIFPQKNKKIVSIGGPTLKGLNDGNPKR